jgi:hypothetical protein
MNVFSADKLKQIRCRTGISVLEEEILEAEIQMFILTSSTFYCQISKKAYLQNLVAVYKAMHAYMMKRLKQVDSD